jgi:phosphatidate cytidylyltransferase
MAIGVGLLLAGLALGSLLFRKEVFVGLVSVAVVLSVWELCTALRSRVAVPMVPLAVGSLGMLVSAFVAGEEGLLVSFTLTVFGMLLWRIIEGLEGAVADVAGGVFAAAYLPFLAGFALVLLAADDGAYRVLTFLAVGVCSDIGGYVSGVLFGRHPLAPTVSPKKTWEGLAGSVTFCLAAGVALVVLLLHGPWWAGAALGLATALTATIGDLAESLLKRDLGVKDMGWLLPGHGGVLDRIDSLLVTAPVAFLLLTLLVPVT